MTSTKVDVLNKINADIDMMSSTSNGINTGFSTPPSSSLDTCDSGFTDLYSNNFTLIKSTNSSICNKTAQTKIGAVDDESNLNLNQSTDSELDSFELSDKVNFDADSKPNIAAEIIKNRSNEGYSPATEYKSHQVAAATSTCRGSENVKHSEYDESNQMDEFNDDSNASDISDLSDVFKLNADILPEMQRSINWVSFIYFLFDFSSLARKKLHQLRNIHPHHSTNIQYPILMFIFNDAFENRCIFKLLRV